MALIMRPQDIDEMFPVAGQDNESAGFRDNFTAIKDSLEYTNDRINTLTDTTVKLGDRNQFTGGTLENVLLVQHSEKTMASSQSIVNPIGQEVSYENGAYHSVVLGTPTSGNSINLDLTGFPALAGEEGRYAKIRLDAKLAAQSTPSVVLEFSNAAGTLILDGGWPASLVVSSYQHPVAVEFWSYDGGNTVFGKYLGIYGETTRTTTVENLAVNGNATLGNASSDRITFAGIPKLPKLGNSVLSTITGIDNLGMIVYNTDNNKIQVFAITELHPTGSWVSLTS